MGIWQSDYEQLKPYFNDGWQIHEHNDKVERAKYQLESDIECARLMLLDTSTSRRNHWYVVAVPEYDRCRAFPVYGAFETPAQANAAMPRVQRFMNAHPSPRADWLSLEVACMPYAPKLGKWANLIDHWEKETA